MILTNASIHMSAEARSAAVGQLDLFVKLEAEERKREQEQLIAKLKADVLASLKGQVIDIS